MGKLRESHVRILSNNQRGMSKDAQIEQVLAWFDNVNAYAAGLQETWKLGDETEVNNGRIILNHGPKNKLCNRGSLGVSIVLSLPAVLAWERAASQRMTFGPRIIATRLHIEDRRGQLLKIFLASAYAPDSSAAHKQDRIDYAADLQRCIDECKHDETLVIAADTNASIGRCTRWVDPNAQAPKQGRTRQGTVRQQTRQRRWQAPAHAYGTQ